MYILWIHLFEKHFKIMFEIKFENMSAYFEKKNQSSQWSSVHFFFLQWNRALWKIYIDHNFRTNILLQSADIMTICEHQWIWYIVIGNKKRIIRYRIITISSCKLIAGKRFLFFFFFNHIIFSNLRRNRTFTKRDKFWYNLDKLFWKTTWKIQYFLPFYVYAFEHKVTTQIQTRYMSICHFFMFKK